MNPEIFSIMDLIRAVVNEIGLLKASFPLRYKQLLIISRTLWMSDKESPGNIEKISEYKFPRAASITDWSDAT